MLPPASALPLPPLAVTGVGSLPFVDADPAIDFVAEEAPRLPFWPQLPRRRPDEGLIRQTLGHRVRWIVPRQGAAGFEILRGGAREFRTSLDAGSADLEPEHAAGFHAFLAAARGGAFPAALAHKGQLTGPVTLAWLLFENETPLGRLPGGLDRVAGFVGRAARAQAEALLALGKPALVVVDEPALFLAGAPPHSEAEARLAQILGTVFDTLRDAGATAGIHTCARPPWSLLRAARPDFVSFDAARDLDSMTGDEDARAIVDGATIAYGLVPTGKLFSAFDAEREARRLVPSLGAFGRPEELVGRSAITASCGLALASPEEARASFASARHLAEVVLDLVREA